MSNELSKAEALRVLTTDARYKVFKEKLKRLGYIKDSAKGINKVMEATAGDFGMMSDAGNKKIARAVSLSKSEEELRAKLEKISTMAGGKYAEAQEDEVVDRAISAFQDSATGSQAWADKNVMVQLGNFVDLSKDGEVSTNDNKKTKVKRDDAVLVYQTLLKVKPVLRDKYLRLLQKDQKTFKKTFDTILRVTKK
jgi:hypothetical protein|tara:strand:+ start:85 stop:669 length:585 start_codon:yes stop_codon:yes gene_type:complete